MSMMIQFLRHIEKIRPIISKICEEKGIAYLVGGSVRDLVLGCEVKDFDIEVHGISLDLLEEILKQFGPVSLVGRQFGVFKLHNFGIDVDWSLPRKDSKGRKPIVEIDPDMTIEQACKRRDVTMNAMAIDLGYLLDNIKEIVSKGDRFLPIIDPYGGLVDLKEKRLRAVDKQLFLDDPLRFYRVMQFVGRFEMQSDDELNEICKTMDLRDASNGGELARERIYEEIKKLHCKSIRPSLGWRWLKDIGRLEELFAELGALIGVLQREEYHPEGDVFEHTMQSLDAAAAVCVKEKMFIKDQKKAFILMMGILCHDFGKATKTDKDGHAKGHDVAGVGPSKSFLRRFTRDSLLIRSVCKLVRYHRMPLALVDQESTLKAYKRLALKLAPEVDFKMLYFVAWCDIRGRNAHGPEPLKNGFADGDKTLAVFLNKISEAGVEEGPEPPVLQGRDLLGIVEAGPGMGQLLKQAYSIQIDEGIKDKEELKKRVL